MVITIQIECNKLNSNPGRVCISLCSNAFKKDLNPSLPSPNYEWIVEQTLLFSFGNATSLREGKTLYSKSGNVEKTNPQHEILLASETTALSHSVTLSLYFSLESIGCISYNSSASNLYLVMWKILIWPDLSCHFESQNHIFFTLPPTYILFHQIGIFFYLMTFSGLRYIGAQDQIKIHAKSTDSKIFNVIMILELTQTISQ